MNVKTISGVETLAPLASAQRRPEADSGDFSRALDDKLRASNVPAYQPAAYQPNDDVEATIVAARSSVRSRVADDVTPASMAPTSTVSSERSAADVSVSLPAATDDSAPKSRKTDDTAPAATAMPMPAPQSTSVPAASAGQAKASSKVDVQTNAGSVVDVKTDANVAAKAAPEAKPDVKAEAKAAAKPDGKSDATTAKPVVGSVTKPETSTVAANSAAIKPAEATTTAVTVEPGTIIETNVTANAGVAGRPSATTASEETPSAVAAIASGARPDVTALLASNADSDGSSTDSDGKAADSDEPNRGSLQAIAAFAPAPSHNHSTSTAVTAVEAPEPAEPVDPADSATMHHNMASITVGEGADKITLRIATTAGGVRVEARTESESLAAALHQSRADLARSLDDHGLSLADLKSNTNAAGHDQRRQSEREPGTSRGRNTTENRGLSATEAVPSATTRRDILA